MPNDPPQNAKNLRRIWNKKKSEMQFTQVTAAKDLEWTQGAISHYLNNVVPLGPAAVVKFANFLGVDPVEIDPNYVNHLPNVAEHAIKFSTNDMSKRLNKKVTTIAFPSAFWVELTDVKLYRYSGAVLPIQSDGYYYAKVVESNNPQQKILLVRLKNQKRADLYHVSVLPPKKKIDKLYNVLRIVYETPKL
jgi:hypothetical protein